MIRFDFEIPGQPMGKQRPKFSTAGGFVKTYTPKETVSYENLVKLMFQQKFGSDSIPKESMIRAKVQAFYSIPKSTSKKKTIEMLDGYVRPIKKPDTDNVAKIILDSLNGIAFHDDAQVVELTVEKWYSENPSVKVFIEEI